MGGGGCGGGEAAVESVAGRVEGEGGGGDEGYEGGGVGGGEVRGEERECLGGRSVDYVVVRLRMSFCANSSFCLVGLFYRTTGPALCSHICLFEST